MATTHVLQTLNLKKIPSGAAPERKGSLAIAATIAETLEESGWAA